ncbi:class C beta-lactamase [Undibacterium flavidum]|uniref:Beta-lactamase n=1 Tax=Undibacterium flavidum TaxID=2762297 RepID=A0ABR6Y789_9BURK|nr:beta-lactamase [Undibacterium flavidum]
MTVIARRQLTLLIAASVLSLSSQAAIHSANEAPKAAAEVEDKARHIVDKEIKALMHQHAIPGMAIALMVNGQAMYFNYGVASKEKNIPVSDKTLFELGSVSKTFTATLGSYAQELGKLSLEDHPSKFIPQLQGTAIDKANLKNLATYTAGGLPLQMPDDVVNDSVNAGMLNYFQQWKPSAAPGTAREYSNPSIGLFGHLTALALKSNFADAMETQLFPKLGLHHSYIRFPESAMPDYAWGYRLDKDELKPVRVNPGVFADEAYGVKSNSVDMLHFVQLNIDSKSLDASTSRVIAGTHIPYFRIGEMGQGLGWEQYPYPISLKRLLAGNSEQMIWEQNQAQEIMRSKLHYAARLFNKTGSTNGFGAYVVFVPELRIGIVMLANKNYPIPARIKAAHAILTQLSKLK